MNADPETTSAWEKLAARHRLVRATESPDDSAPFGFAQRIAAQAMALRRNERLAWWTRWSMRAAALAGLAVVIMALKAPPSNPAGPLLSAPGLEIPGLSSL